jgi:predicted AAA+ superfamily ATPase
MDAGALWENFLMSERKKYLDYHRQWANTWYWRTKEQNEIDYIEEEGGLLRAYEFKWNPKAKVKLPKTFLQTYPNSQFAIIHPGNVEDFLFKQ